MTDAQIMARIALAISQQDADSASPSGPVRALLSAFAEEGELRAISLCYLAHRKAHPRAAQYVLSKIPEKMYNGYLCGHANISRTALDRWAADHPTWRDEVRSALTNPAMFDIAIAAAADDARRYEPT